MPEELTKEIYMMNVETGSGAEVIKVTQGQDEAGADEFRVWRGDQQIGEVETSRDAAIARVRELAGNQAGEKKESAGNAEISPAPQT